MKNKLSLKAVLLGMLLGGVSAPALAIGLAEVIESAKRNDPAYKAAIASLNASSFERGLGLSNLLPNLSGSLQKGKAEYDREQLSREGAVVGTDNSKVDLENYALTLRQPLFNLDAIARYRSGQDTADLGELEFQQFENDFIAKLVTAYIDVLRALDIRDTTEAEFRAMKSLVDLTEKEIRGGESNKLNLLEAVAKRDIADAQFIEAQQNLENSVRVLESMSDLKIYRIANLKDDEPVELTPSQNFEVIKHIAIANNPKIAAASKEIELAENEVTKALAGHAPRVDLLAVQSKSQNDSVNTIDLKTDASTISLQMQVPLFSGFAAENQRQKNLQLVEKARNKHKSTIQQITVELRKHFTAVSISRQKINAFDKAVASSAEAVKAAELGMKAGLNVEYDSLSARQQLTKAKLEASKVKYDSIQSSLLLNATAGILSSETLGALTRMFDQTKSSVEIIREEPPEENP